MYEITIQAYGSRRLSEKLLHIGNMQENKITKIIFELDDDIAALGGNVYLFISVDGQTYPYRLKDNAIEIGCDITQHRRVKSNLVVSVSDHPTEIKSILDGAVWISDNLELWVDKNNINKESVSETEFLMQQAVNDFEDSILGGEW